MPSETVLGSIKKDVKSALHLWEITLKGNETVLFSFHVHVTATMLELGVTTYGMAFEEEKSLLPLPGIEPRSSSL